MFKHYGDGKDMDFTYMYMGTAKNRRDITNAQSCQNSRSVHTQSTGREEAYF